MQETFAAAVDQVLRDSPVAARAVSAGTERDGFFVSSPTLSQWRSGDAVPYLTEDTLHRLLSVERWAEAPPGSLVRGLHRASAPDRGPVWRWNRLPNGSTGPGPQALKAQLEARGVTNRCRTTLVTGADDYVIDRHRRPRESRHRQRICAVVPGVDSVWTVFTFMAGSPSDLVPVEGCRVGRTEETAAGDYGVRAVELLLDTRLDVGEGHDLAFTLVRPPHPAGDGELWPGWMRMVEEPGCRRLDMRIRFEEDQRPNEAWQGTWTPGPDGVPEHDRHEPVTADGGWFVLSRTNPKPGAYGIHWRWPGDREAATPIGAGPEEPR